MRHQIMYLLENMLFEQHKSICLSNFKFTANYPLFNDYFTEVIRNKIGTSNSVYIKGSGIVYYDESPNFNAVDGGESAIRGGLRQSTEHKTDMIGSFINALWLVKDNSISIQCYVSKLIPTDWGVVWIENPRITNATGEVSYTMFKTEELEEAHNLWCKFRKNISHPDIYEKSSTLIMTVEQGGDTRSRLKTFHKQFDYSKTNCVERALHFITIARNQDYLIYKISFYMSAFECLFTTDSEAVVNKLRYRVAFYVGANKSERIDIDSIIKEGYNVRSKFMHGQVWGKKKPKYEDLVILSLKLDNILRLSLKKIITEDFELFNINTSDKDSEFHKWAYRD